MKRMVLIVVGALSLGSLLLAPNDAEARCRHCRPRVRIHRTYRYVPSFGLSYYYGPRYYEPSYYGSGYYGSGYYGPSTYAYDDDYGYGPGYYGYSSYYTYPPRYSVRVYAPRPYVGFHYHGRARCYRHHRSVRIGW